MPVSKPQSGQPLAVTAQGGLYLRMGPSTDTQPIIGMPFGAIVQATGQEQNAFAQVVYNGQTGWASEAYLAEAPQVQQVAQVAQQLLGGGMQQVAQQQQGPAGVQLGITGQDVALRSQPMISTPDFGNGSNVIVLTNKGEVVTTLGPRQNAFTQVNYKGREGWMSDRYLGVGAGPSPGPLTQPKPQQPPPIAVSAKPTPQGGSATFVLGLGILLAAGYFMVK